MYALKLYLAFSSEQQKSKATETRVEEAKKWNLFYPSYAMAVQSGELLGVSCLAMPYVASIPTSRRLDLLDKIERELARFAGMGYSYRETDLRWRHIGLRKDKNGNEIVILVDLESMDYCGDGKLGKEDVLSALAQLRTRAQEEPVNAGQHFVHAV